MRLSNSNPQTILLLYSKQNHDLAKKISKDLRKNRYVVWHKNGAIEDKGSLSPKTKAIKHAGIVCTIITKQSVRTQWMRNELKDLYLNNNKPGKFKTVSQSKFLVPLWFPEERATNWEGDFTHHTHYLLKGGLGKRFNLGLAALAAYLLLLIILSTEETSGSSVEPKIRGEIAFQTEFKPSKQAGLLPLFTENDSEDRPLYDSLGRELPDRNGLISALKLYPAQNFAFYDIYKFYPSYLYLQGLIIVEKNYVRKQYRVSIVQYSYSAAYKTLFDETIQGRLVNVGVSERVALILYRDVSKYKHVMAIVIKLDEGNILNFHRVRWSQKLADIYSSGVYFVY